MELKIGCTGWSYSGWIGPFYPKNLESTDYLKYYSKTFEITEVRDLMPQAIKIYKKYLRLLENQKVPIEELSFTTRASKNVEEYKVTSVQKDAMIQLKEQGESIKAGQKIQYIITDYSRKTKRSAPLEMTNGKYDVKRYAKLLAECCTSVTKPFGKMKWPE